MMRAKIAQLPDRGVVRVTGADARKLLNGIITNDMDDLHDGESERAGQAIFAGLLSPQGKVLFDFFVVSGPDGFQLDVSRDKAADLVKRLAMYKLRAAVTIEDVSADTVVSALWGPEAHSFAQRAWPDPRSPDLGLRLFSDRCFAVDDAKASNGFDASPAEYHARRIALGIPEGGHDFAFGEVFSHEVLMDQLNGLSFTKGCYVGQEIVSRMEHRGTARKRFVRVTGAEPLPARGTDILAGDVAIGSMGSSTGRDGLALLRLDRVAEFAAKGVGLTVGGGILSPNLDDVARLMPRVPLQDAL
jgi:tRNA-modifying protein YgfZ